MRSRPHVVTVRLNDKEYAIYEAICRKARRESVRFHKNRSELFRDALVIMGEMIKQDAFEYFYTHGLEF